MLEKVIIEIVQHGKEITFSIVCIVILFIFYKVVIRMLDMMKDKDDNLNKLTDEVSALRTSLDNITSFLNGLIKGREGK